MDEAHCSPGLHAAAGPGLAEECAALVCYLIEFSYSQYGSMLSLHLAAPKCCLQSSDIGHIILVYEMSFI